MVDDRDDHTEVATIEGATAESPATPAARGSVRRVSTDRYRVVSRLGKGGMGEVMHVRDDVVGRDVALKRIRRSDPSERMQQRFLREATIQGRLEHPAIVPLYDIGRDSAGLPFFTMKKLTGTTLSKILATSPPEMTLQRLLRAFAEVCLAIELAHVRGVIHRDLKPENIVLGDYGEVYVLDWGVAKVIGEADDDLADLYSGSSEDGARATVPGTQIGTPGYMAPEQVRGEPDVDARVDVYALGCILFEILTGTMLHPTGKAGLASAVQGVDARPSVRAPERVIAPELDELCVAATHVDRDKRIQTARELGERVQRFLDGDRDLELRQKLAAEHLTRARAAFAAGDDQRAVAMREAASAIALDPTLTSAAELLGRLMLEPPKTLPAEVEAELREEDDKTVRNSARVAGRSYVGFLAFLPLVWWIAPAGSPYVLALSGLVIVNMALCWWGVYTRHTAAKAALLAIANALLLAVIARMYAPFLIAPALAAMSVMAILFTPLRSKLTSTTGVVILTWLAVLGPWLLEHVGVLSTTITVDERGVLFDAVAIAGDETSTLVVGALYVAALIAAAAGMASGIRERERLAKRHLHLQAWQLRQLVPRTGPPA
jgi:tRNA A-37 threonylcarbamoyl transferase component Bud32